MGSKHRLVRWLALVVFIAAMASPALAQLQKKRTPPPAPAATPPAAPSPAKVQDPEHLILRPGGLHHRADLLTQMLDCRGADVTIEVQHEYA